MICTCGKCCVLLVGGGGDSDGEWLCCCRWHLNFTFVLLTTIFLRNFLKFLASHFLLPSPMTFIFTTLNTLTSLLYPLNNPNLLYLQDFELTPNLLLLIILLPSFFVPSVIFKTLKDVPTSSRIPYTFYLLPFPRERF